MGSQDRPAAAGASKRKSIQIPGFEIEAEVGRGGMGIVYRARQTSIGRQVAVKVLPTAATKNPTFVERFLREAKAAARLNHENVVSAIDAGRSGDVVYFVMEFIDGETIRERIDREGPLPLDIALAVLRDTARALVHAHRHGLVHRDVKPDNIMLNADGRALLCDLGLARMAEEGKAAEGKRTGIAEGTPYYIAPEQAKGFADIDIRADIYALGASAYHMLAGEYPFDGADAREIMLKQVNQPFPDVTAARADLPPSLVELLGRMVEKDRAARIATPAEVVAELERVMAETGSAVAVADPEGAPGLSRQAMIVGGVGAALALVIAIAGGAWVLKPRPKAAKVPQAVERPHAESQPAVVERRPEEAPAHEETPRPDAGGTSAMAREAEAARKLELLRVEIDSEKVDLYDAAQRYRDFAAFNYPDTRAAATAKETAARLDDQAKQELDQRIKTVDSRAAELCARGDFAGAATLYWTQFLEKDKNGKAEPLVRPRIRKVEDLCSSALVKLEQELKPMAKNGQGLEAAARLDAFLEKAAGAAAIEKAKKLVSFLRSGPPSGGGGERPQPASESDAATRTVRDLVRAGGYAEAQKLVEASLGDPKNEPARLALESLRRHADAAAQCAGRIAVAFEGLALEPSSELPLLAGGAVSGKVLGYDRGTGVAKVAEPGAPKDAGQSEVALADLAPAFLRKLAAAPKEDHLGASYVFLRFGALQAAVEELQALQKAGDLTGDMREDLDAAQARTEDALARAVHRRGATLARLGKLADALVLLQRVIPGGDLGGTPSAKGAAKPIGDDWKRARAAQLVGMPLASFFAGKAVAKGKKLDVTYNFSDPSELADWIPRKEEEGFTESRVKQVGSAVEFTGRVTWRGAFKGEIGFEAAVVSGGQNVNANFVFYDRGHPWDGWLLGIGATVPDITIFQLSKNAPQRTQPAFEFPSHLVGRMKGSLAQTEFLFGARGPVAPSTGGFRIGVSVKRRVMTVMFMGKTLTQLPIMDEKDMSGGIAVQPFYHNLVLEEIRLQGEVDDAWLRTEAAARAEAELAAAGKKP